MQLNKEKTGYIGVGFVVVGLMPFGNGRLMAFHTACTLEKAEEYVGRHVHPPSLEVIPMLITFAPMQVTEKEVEEVMDKVNVLGAGERSRALRFAREQDIPVLASIKQLGF